MSRRRVPTELKRRMGNPSKERLNDQEPKPGPASLVPPPKMPPAAVEIWNELAPKLAAMGTFGDVDRLELAKACRWQAVHDALLEKEEDRVLARGGTISPGLAFLKIGIAANKIFGAFGVTAAPRALIKATPGANGDSDPVESFKQARPTIAAA